MSLHMQTNVSLFPFSEFWWLYSVFIAFIVGILITDIYILNKNPAPVTLKKSLLWSGIWIALALCFGVVLYYFSLHHFSNSPELLAIPNFNPQLQAKTTFFEYLTGYVVEKALSLDNIFIFSLIFSYFSIPNKYQHRILFWGLFGALILRALFISLGAILMKYKIIVIAFGILILITGVKTIFTKKADPQDLAQHFFIRFLKRIIPMHPVIEGPQFFIRLKGVMHATPLFVALAFIEFSDVIFAVDSVPAIYTITKEPLIVFTSNIFAILGLRTLYFSISYILEKFWFMQYGLAFILIFIGLKMIWLNEVFEGGFPILWSLGILLGALVMAILISIVFQKKSDTQVT